MGHDMETVLDNLYGSKNQGQTHQTHACEGSSGLNSLGLAMRSRNNEDPLP